jgi:Uma2 family endonuclease
MPVAIVESSVAGPPLPRKRFTRSEVEAMLEAGVFEGQRFELIDGDLIDKMGQKPPHMFAIQRCQELFIELFGSARVRVQGPMEAGPVDREKSMPEPDVLVLREAKDEYRERHPSGPESVLVVEVADTTVRPDLTRKRDLYASAGVQEYWVLDLKDRRLVVHRALGGANAKFASIESYSEDETVDFAGQAVRVGDLLT